MIHRQTCPLERLPFQTAMLLATYEELSYSHLDKLDGDQGQDFRMMISKAVQETTQGVALSVDRIVVVGQKA